MRILTIMAALFFVTFNPAAAWWDDEKTIRKMDNWSGGTASAGSIGNANKEYYKKQSGGQDLPTYRAWWSKVEDEDPAAARALKSVGLGPSTVLGGSSRNERSHKEIFEEIERNNEIIRTGGPSGNPDVSGAQVKAATTRVSYLFRTTMFDLPEPAPAQTRSNPHSWGGGSDGRSSQSYGGNYDYGSYDSSGNSYRGGR